MPSSDSDLSNDELSMGPAAECRARSPREKTDRGLVVSWKMATYYVPSDSVISLPKTPFKIDDPQALGSLLSTKCAEKWLPVCKPEHLLMLKGKEGTACYATFIVPGHDNECRFIRHIPTGVASKNFPKVLEAMEADPTKAPQNDRQKKRLEVLNWKTSDCSAPQIDPKYNDWPVCSEENLKSCRIDPTTRPGKRDHADACAATGNGMLPAGIKFLRVIPVEDNAFEVLTRPGSITIIGFDNAAAAVPSPELVET